MITIINDLLIYIMLVMTNYEISIINDKLDELLKILKNNNSRNKDEELGKEKNSKT
jgi:hypothetical protein